MKVLNLYAGIGGNRKLWENVEVTAVENNPKIAEIYQDFFPNDNVVVADAHQYLLDHYKEFDFIWSSPPCPSHSRIRNVANVGCGRVEPIYVDMKLYEEILFFRQITASSGVDFKGKWVVENVVSYYEPLIKPHKAGRHYFWSNFIISQFRIKSRGHMKSIEEMEKLKGFSAKDSPIRKDTLLRNCTEPELGLHIFECAFKVKQKTLECERSVIKYE